MEHRILTIPNILSAFRLLLIPVIVWLYCVRGAYHWALGVLVLSGLTDIADGYIARHFHMTSDLGKMLDPIADKLTQAATLLCLGTKFPVMFLLAAVLAVKEAITGAMALAANRKTGQVKGAVWHGKLTTVLLYLTMIVHLLWSGIPHAATLALAMLCLAVMALSFVLYLIQNWTRLRQGG